MTISSSRRQPRPIRRMALPPPHVVSARGWNFMDVFVAGLIITGLITSVLLGAAALLGSLYLVLWVARQVVGLVL
jgi:hypothetical protein